MGEHADATPRIVVGIDAGSASAGALSWARAEAAVRGADVWAVHVWQESGEHAAPYAPATEPGHGRRNAAARFAAFLREHTPRAANVPVRAVLEHGDPAVVLPRVADGADLLVVGARIDPSLPVTLGPTLRACLRSARCPVVVVTATAPAGAAHDGTRPAAATTAAGWS